MTTFWETMLLPIFQKNFKSAKYVMNPVLGLDPEPERSFPKSEPEPELQ
jgi:hypothetical protein